MNDISQRAEQARLIASNPHDYKVCEGCGSILRLHAVICPVCKAYRFDESAESVIQQANLLGSREPTTITEEDL